jgi:hypothetical protein
LINNITHVFEVFKTPDTILKPTRIVKGWGFQSVPLDELVDTTNEQLVDDLVTCVKHVVIGDWFQGRNLVFKGV